jgi:hypothetical protein
MIDQNRRNKTLILLAGIGLLGSMPVASMPVTQNIPSVIIQETAIPQSNIIYVEKLYGYMWSGYATTEDKSIVR